eukprot:67227-Amphidinium_carterae.1
MVLHGGSWRVSWSLTGVPEPRPAGAGALYQGLSSAAELAASVQYVKDAHALEEIMRKQTGSAAPPSQGHGSTRGHPGPASSPATPSSGSSRRRRGTGRGGLAPEPAK